MTTCSDSFWFWFMRPVAETLGALAMISVVGVVMVAAYMIILWRRK
jgi:hypothetical protein